MIKTTRSEQKIRGVVDIAQLEKTPYNELVPFQSIYEVFQATARLFGDRTALTMLRSADLEDVPVTYTHSELLADITRAANMFAQFGIESEGVVSIIARTHARVPALIWGAETAGIVSCINYLLAPDVIAALLDAEAVQIVVCPGPTLDPELWAKVLEILPRVKGLQTVQIGRAHV